MQQALDLAAQAMRITSPNPRVGCVIVNAQGQVIGQGHTQRAGGHHAEIMALQDAAHQGHSVEGATAYVTLEPCAMCMGAMMHARLARVVFGAHDPKTGVCGSVLDLPSHEQLNHHTEVQGGVLSEACGNVLRQFFKKRRMKDAVNEKTST